MKASMIALAFAAFATTGFAYAATPAPTSATQSVVVQTAQWSPAHQDVAGKTRAEVRQELVQAEHDGQLAYLNKFYQGS